MMAGANGAEEVGRGGPHIERLQMAHTFRAHGLADILELQLAFRSVPSWQLHLSFKGRDPQTALAQPLLQRCEDLGMSEGPAPGKFYKGSTKGVGKVGPKSDGGVAQNSSQIDLAKLGL